MATYEYQLSKTDEADLEPIRQTALVLEDMIQVITGIIPAYPYYDKKKEDRKVNPISHGRVWR